MIKTGKELALAARQVAENYKTVYAKGCFGWPMNETNKNRAIASYAYNAKQERADKIRAADENTFAFDCVCFIKALLWGWEGNSAHIYGGATYVSGGVPDINEKKMIQLCQEVTENFDSIEMGEVVWMQGHIGIYIGSGLVVECTPKWNEGVQITALHNMTKKTGYNGRVWTSHGKLPYVQYEKTFTLTLPVLEKGMKGEQVRSLQMLLIGHGYDCGKHGVDGSFGGATRSAVLALQKDLNLEQTGVADEQVLAYLMGDAYE